MTWPFPPFPTPIPAPERSKAVPFNPDNYEDALI